MEIKPFYNKKEKKTQWRARFQFKGKEYKPVADTKAELLGLIDEIRVQKRRATHNLSVPEAPGPKLAELFERILPTVSSKTHYTLCERVFRDFMALLPAGIRVKELRKSHYQIYIDWRSSQISQQTRKPVQRETIYKELWAVSGALGNGELYWSELENWKKPSLPKNTEQNSKQEKRRTKIVSPENELYVLLDALRQPKTGKQTLYTEMHRRRLADDLEFRYETGLRRKEVARLQLKQFIAKDVALRNVKRWKTNTTTKFFPLSPRALEIIKNRINLLNGDRSPQSYLFTDDGEPVDSDYRTLKKLCKKLDIPYGKYVEDGFIPHDLRHNFASDVIKHTDIETARELLGHSNIEQTGDYLHTDENRMRDAIRRRAGVDLKKELIGIYKGVRRKKISAKSFIERIKNLAIV